MYGDYFLDKMARKLGTVPVPVNVNNMGPMFNTGQVDSLGAPALAINAFRMSASDLPRFASAT